MDQIMFYILIAVAVILTLSIIAAVVFSIKKRKSAGPKVKVSTDFLSNLESLLGGKNNIASVTNDGGRIKFVLNDIKQADLEGLKTIAKSGVLVSGNTIKMLFEYSLEHVITYFN